MSCERALITVVGRRVAPWPAVLLCLAIWAGDAAAQGPAGGEIDALRAEIAALREEYDSRLAALESRMAALEAARAAEQPGGPPVALGDGDELARLRAAARRAAGTPAGPAPVGPDERPAPGRLNLNRLNPEISMTGMVLGIASDREREEFERGEFELDLQATLDPFSSTRWTIAVDEEGEFDVEEGYVTWAGLGGGLELTGGRFRQRFGALNRQHLHALPQSDYPLVLTTLFGEEGLGQTGVSLTWLLPRPWATANEISLQITDGESDFFAGEEFERLAVLARLKNFWDLDPATYFEWGLSAIAGETESGGTGRVWGTDFTFHWQPPRRAKYRELTWRTELLLSERDDPLGERQQAWGGYSYVEGLLARNLYLGLRLDRAEDPVDPAGRRWGLVPYITWWQSEWVRLRGEYRYLEDDLTGEEENRLVLQLTWAAGPHKHETY